MVFSTLRSGLRQRPLVVLWVVALLAVRVLPLHAQSPSVTAEVDRSELTTDDTVTLTVVVTGSGRVSQPTLPALDGLQILGTSRASQISIVNGVTNTQTIYRYTLQPLQTGEIEIGSISVIIDDQTYTTEPITLQVTQGSGTTTTQPGAPVDVGPLPQQLANADFFVEGEVDNPTPYRGQQIVYTFRFYLGERLVRQPAYNAPEFSGFWSQEASQQEQYTVQNEGKNYRVIELDTILFPTSAGERTISPATLEIPGTLLQAEAALRTEPVTVTVRPLPTPAPDGFSGAVGRFQMTATVDNSEVAVNEPLTLRVVLSGEGNIETLPDPTWPQMEGWRAFDSTVTTNTEEQDGRLAGSRVYEQIMIPSQAGGFTIPAFSYVYFDPEAEQYVTLTTEPLVVNVAAGAAQPPVPAVPGADREEVERLATDIRHIKPVPPALESARLQLTANVVYWLAWLLPLLLVGADFVWQRRQQRLAANPALVRRSQALKKAQRLLAETGREQHDPYTVTGRVLVGYLSDKLNQPVAGLTQAALADLLRRKGVEEKAIGRVKDILTLSEMGRFSPLQQDGNQDRDLYKETQALLLELESSFA